MVMIVGVGLLRTLQGAAADVVYTSSGRIEGQIAVGQGEVRIGERKIPLEQVVLLVRQTAGRTISAPQALRMKTGEIWHVDLTRVLAKKMRFVSPFAGEREVDLAAVAAIDFVLNPQTSGMAANTLYRDEGEPIPGSIIWIDPTRIALQSPLGALTLPREGLLRYVFSTDAPASEGDELTLIDGSVYRGTLRTAADGFEMSHAMLGAVNVPLAAVRSIRRQRMAQHIDMLKVVQKDVFGAGEARFVVRGEAGEAHQPFIQVFTLTPGASAMMEAARGGTLRMAIGPVRGAQSPVAARIVAAGKVLWEKPVALQDKPVDVSIDVPAGQVSVEILPAGQPLRFPAGVELMDLRIE